MLIALANPPTLAMYGVGGFFDTANYTDYDPWEHAEAVNARIVSNMTLPDGIYAAYSSEMHVIFFRAGLPDDVERCAIAHELVHFEHRDKGGHCGRAEARAERVSALRLIRPSRIAASGIDHCDLSALARELNVTENTMRLYARMARNGTLPRGL